MTRQPRLSKEERMLQIRNHAKNIFLKKGFERTTMEEVVKESGMSKGGVYRHYSSTTQMLYDLMIDGNDYRQNLNKEYLKNKNKKDKYELIGEILVDKALAQTDLMKLYVIFLKVKEHHKELNDLYFKLEEIAKQKFNEVAKELEIKSDIFSDGFLINYINGIILSNVMLNGKEIFEEQRVFLKQTFICYIKKLDRNN
ncbi:TetR/AcrR family transcriptional regulator [Helcococcus ovis]|uniref:TetR/AcrR family transcriptional regulator n=1 Tax=Helcococcus ovis TaxID=72026 RepID=UPI0038BAFF9C